MKLYAVGHLGPNMTPRDQCSFFSETAIQEILLVDQVQYTMQIANKLLANFSKSLGLCSIINLSTSVFRSYHFAFYGNIQFLLYCFQRHPVLNIFKIKYPRRKQAWSRTNSCEIASQTRPRPLKCFLSNVTWSAELFQVSFRHLTFLNAK